MNAQDLKNSILQRAIEGKLVPQRKEEGTAKELLAEIRAEKARLIKEKKIKKSKPLPEITDEEKPFDIPESWEWVRFGNIADIASNLVDPHDYPDYQQIGPDLIEKETGRLLGNRTVKENHIRSGNHFFHKGQILYSKIRPALKKATIAPYDGLCSADMYPINSWIDKQYLLFMMLSDSFTVQTQSKANRVKMPKINQSGLVNIILPLPPLAEQHRIVAKIEELQPDIDAYDKAQTKLQSIEQSFPDDMKKSLLQYAIEGKLVPQRKEEGTAKDLLAKIRAEKARLVKEKKIKKTKPLPAITDDEKPFDIPDSWEWVRLGDVVELQSGQDFPSSKYSDTDTDGIPYITGASSFLENGVLENRWTRFPKCIATEGDILLVCKGTSGKVTICNLKKVHIARQIMAIKKNRFLDILYVKLFIMANESKLTKSARGVIPGISRETVLNLLFPLPPLFEQHRIVAKLEELLPLCQQLACHP